MSIAPNEIRVKFEGGAVVPLEYAAPFTMKQIRGTQPYYFNVLVENADTFPAAEASGDGMKCSFVFKTPGLTGGEVEMEWDSWYLVRREKARSDDKLHIFTFADERWRLQYRKESYSANIRWPNGQYRYETSLGGSPLSCYGAIQEVLSLFGYDDYTFEVAAGKQYIPLPDNLGNSPAGGWAFATFEEMMDPILEAMDADLIFHDRSPVIVDRSGDLLGSLAHLKTLPRSFDSVGSGENTYERPRKLRLGFEVKMEVPLERGISQTSSARHLAEPVNVMPRFELAALTEGLKPWIPVGQGQVQPAPAKSEWSPIATELVQAGYWPPGGVLRRQVNIAAILAEVDTFCALEERDIDRLLIGKNWYHPNIIPVKRDIYGNVNEDPNTQLGAFLYLKKQWFHANLKAYWRKLWRIHYPSDLNNTRTPSLRNLSGLKVGRLSHDGASLAAGSVYSDWSEELLIGYVPGSATTGTGVPPFEQLWFSANHDFSPSTPSPFTAKLLQEDGDELLLSLDPPQRLGINQERILPALFQDPLNYGSWIDLSADAPVAVDTANGELSEIFRFRIFLNGRLVQDNPNLQNELDGVEGRMYIIERELFPEGSVEELDLKSVAHTANFGYSYEQTLVSAGGLVSQWPNTHLNWQTLQDYSNGIVDQVKSQFETGEAGALVHPGVGAPALGIGTGGSILEMSVIVGDPDPHSIKTQYWVMPNLPAVELSGEKRDGKPTTLIDYS